MKNIDNIHVVFIALAIILIPFTGISGLSILGGMGNSASIYPILVGMMIWILCSWREIKIPKGHTYRLLMVFYFIAISSVVINVGDIKNYHYMGQSGVLRAIVQLGSLFVCMIIPIYLYNNMLKYRKNPYEFFFKYVMISFFIAGSYSAVEIMSFLDFGSAKDYLTSLNSLFRAENDLNYQMRLRSVTSEPSSFGAYCTILLPWIIFQSGQKKRYSFILIYLILLCLLSLSRTAYVVLLVQFLTCFILYGEKQRKNMAKITVIALILSGILYTQAEDYFGERSFDVVVMSVLDSEGTVFDLSNIARYGSQEAAINMFFDNPILGVGYGMYGFLAPDYYPQYAWISNEILYRSVNWTDSINWPSVYSLIARLFGETGMLGGLVWIMVNLSAMYSMVKKARCFRKTNAYMYLISATVSLFGCFVMEFKTDSIYTFSLWMLISLSLLEVDVRK